MEYFIGAFSGYLVGAFNPSYIIGKAKGFDIRRSGSGNAGASNAVITMGKFIGLICTIVDIMKAYGIIKLLVWLFPNDGFVYTTTAAATILGHIFPFYMHFRGGKGLACLGGAILAYSPLLFIIFLAAEILIVLIVDYICIVPVTASIAFPIVYGILEMCVFPPLVFGIATLAIQYRHIENFKRIGRGAEMHLSYLWKGEAEKQRVLNNTDEFSTEIKYDHK